MNNQEQPMTEREQIEQIARGLTKAQRRYLTTQAMFRKPKVWAQERWMTFPPPNTHRVLMQLGLVDGVGQFTPLGLAVRDHLKGNSDE